MVDFLTLLKANAICREDIREYFYDDTYLKSFSSDGDLQWINSWSLSLSNKYVRCHIIRQKNEATLCESVINTVIMFRDKRDIFNKTLGEFLVQSSIKSKEILKRRGNK